MPLITKSDDANENYLFSVSSHELSATLFCNLIIRGGFLN